MKIAEIYSSKQGEGLLTGTPSIFVRTSGCNLRCDFCDTPFTSWNPEGDPMSIDSIMQRINGFAERHVVITGGEPMMPARIGSLTQLIRSEQRHVTIETAGTILREVECDLMSISPKLANSTPTRERAGDRAKQHEESRINLPVLKGLIGGWEHQLKFVVSAPDDIHEILQLLEKLPAVDGDRVLLMPEGVNAEVLQQRMLWLEPLCQEYGFRPCPRMHLEWYGNKRGT